VLVGVELVVVEPPLVVMLVAGDGVTEVLSAVLYESVAVLGVKLTAEHESSLPAPTTTDMTFPAPMQRPAPATDKLPLLADHEIAVGTALASENTARAKVPVPEAKPTTILVPKIIMTPVGVSTKATACAGLETRMNCPFTKPITSMSRLILPGVPVST